MFKIFKSKDSSSVSKNQTKDDDWVNELKYNESINDNSEQLEIKAFNKKENSASRTKLGLSIDHIKILKKCKHENSALELMQILNRSNKSKFKLSIINPLVREGFLKLKFPDKPKNPKQKYIFTNKFVRPNK